MSYINHEEKMRVINAFPTNIKLSYENMIHKTVYSDFVAAIPEGKKYFAWFTNLSRQDICYLLKVGENQKVVDVKCYRCCFSNDLKQGTILYGTKFRHNNNNMTVFAIEDVLFYKGDDISEETWLEKMELFRQLMKFDIKQVVYDKSYLLFGLPIMNTNVNDLIKEIQHVPDYSVTKLCFREMDMDNLSLSMKIQRDEQGQYCLRNYNHNINSSNTNSNNNESHFKKMRTFMVKPSIQSDIYYLHDYIDHRFIDLAFIPDYKTSVMMNQLFRDIKENVHLDALEESDNEDEFENIDEDRFVHLERKIPMQCTFHAKFKKWIPLRVIK